MPPVETVGNLLLEYYIPLKMAIMAKVVEEMPKVAEMKIHMKMFRTIQAMYVVLSGYSKTMLGSGPILTMT